MLRPGRARDPFAVPPAGALTPAPLGRVDRVADRDQRRTCRSAQLLSSGSNGRKVTRQLWPPDVHGVFWFASFTAASSSVASSPETVTQPGWLPTSWPGSAGPGQVRA